MALLEQIAADLKTAMLARQAETVSIIRLLQSELKNAKIKKGDELTDDEVIQVVRREVKKRQDAATLYTQQNQPERAKQELAEVSVLETYLPAKLDSNVIATFIKEKQQELGISGPAARGQLIKETLAHFGTAVDGKQVSQLVADIL